MYVCVSVHCMGNFGGAMQGNFLRKLSLHVCQFLSMTVKVGEAVQWNLSIWDL